MAEKEESSASFFFLQARDFSHGLLTKRTLIRF
jgi:hypothetical protein